MLTAQCSADCRDIDETLIIFNSLLTGSWAASHGLNCRNIFQPLGERWEAAILNISDCHFFYAQVLQL